MRVIRRVVVAFASFVILPATVFAQASVSGFIKDTSGARAARRECGSLESGADRKGAYRNQRLDRTLPNS